MEIEDKGRRVGSIHTGEQEHFQWLPAPGFEDNHDLPLPSTRLNTLAMADSSHTTLPSRGKPVFVVTTITFVLATVFVVARLVSRFGILKHRTADDWVMILAWVSGAWWMLGLR